MDRPDPEVDAGRGADLATASSRHLLHRGHRPAHPRPQVRQPRRPRPRQAGGRGGGGHGGGRGGQGPLRCGADLGPRRRDRGGAPHLAQARRHPLGDRPGRDPADPAGQRAARPDRGPGGRADEDRARRRGRRPARRRGVRLRLGAAGGVGLHHDAGLPPRHLSRRHRHPDAGAAGQVQRQARVRRDVLRVRGRGGARAPGRTRPALAR